jgi:single-strand DNA-binding protein
MRGINRVTLIGNLGRDPELRTSANGTVSWCTFSLATTRSRKQGDEWVDQTDWHRIKVFGTQAELCSRYLSKGRMVYVEGSVTYDQWERDGVKRTTTVIMADQVTFLPAGGDRRVAAHEVAEAK